MYVEKIKINKFRVLEDVEIRFQPPDLTAVEEGRGNGNVVNVVAGVNGTGKTSLLEAVFRAIQMKHGFPASALNMSENSLDDETLINLDMGLEEDARLISYPAQQSLNYETKLSVPITHFVKIKPDDLLGNSELFIKEYVVAKERESSLPDPKQRTKLAIDSFNKHFLEAKMLTKLVNLDSAQFNRPVFENAAGERVTIDQLSDGEKQLYGRVIALMILEPQNSVVLIDEPEIALHPAWQQKIMQIYSNIGKNNQFIVATHSPQVIRSVPYQNRIILHKQAGKIQPLYYTQPPSGVDVNTILSEVMGADPVPSQLTELQAKYRALVERKQENSDEAKKLKAELLDYESGHSSFMQEMEFLIELRDAA